VVDGVFRVLGVFRVWMGSLEEGGTWQGVGQWVQSISQSINQSTPRYAASKTVVLVRLTAMQEDCGRHQLAATRGPRTSHAARSPCDNIPLYLVITSLLLAIMVTSPECTLYGNLYINLRETAVVYIYNPLYNRCGYKAAVVVAVALQLNTSLRELCIWIDIGDSGAAAIAEALTLNTSLQRLNLRNSSIGSSGTAAIAEALKLNTSLQRLDLYGNEIGASGAAAVAEALKLNTSLEILYLHRNEIGDSGAAAIAEALKLNTSLQRLYLHRNEIGDSGAAAVAEALTLNTSLEILSLYNNKIGDSGAAAIAAALKLNASLWQLVLARNEIGDSGAAAIVEALKLNSSVRELCLVDNTFGYAGSAKALEFLLARQHVNPRPILVIVSDGATAKVVFFERLLRKGFTTFLVDAVPPALLPHALAKVSNFPSLLLHLLRQMLGVQIGEFYAWSKLE
jgi:hypothetical protein